MVFKVSKGGVRSGNTLRGLQARRTKLYGRHACLIGFSSLGRRGMNSLLTKSSEEDSLVWDTLKRTNVLLSLNKKQRWRVPAIINQMISNGNFEKKTMISLLERHKLKRRANCVRFASNGGRLKSVAPKHKKYFSFSLDKIDEEESNRKKRRLKAEQLKKQGAPKLKLLKRNRSLIKTIDTFTSDGHKTSNANKALDSSKEEYRMEVFYPCPQSCSLTFNPKYTDVVLEEGKTGHLEVKSNIKTSRSGYRHHRRRFNMKDIDTLYNETIEEDVSEMWKACYDSDPEEYHDEEHKIESSKCPINDLEMLINQAENAKKLFIKKKHQHKKEKVHKQNAMECLDAKNTHIMYIEPENDDSRKENPQSTLPPQYLQEINPLASVKVILKSSETTVESLEEKYGALYSEANSLPRRFIINITDDVTNLLYSTKSSSKNLMFVSYLVFIYDGIYDDGLDCFRVIFNSNSCKNVHNLSEYIPFTATSIDDVMNFVIGYLLDLKERKELDIDLDLFNFNRTGIKGMYDFLYNRINMKVNSFDPSYALAEESVFEIEQEHNITTVDSHLAFLSVDFDQEIFCDVCYENINPTRIDAVHGTKLSKCNHNCCDNCWASHFQSRIRNGATIMTCPGYNCNNEIGFATLLSILHVSDIALIFQRKTEEGVEISDNAKWCPNPVCGRVIKVDSRRNDLCQDVVCACGTEICFACFGSAHWPAKCSQAEKYLEKLTTLKPPKENVEDPEVKPNLQLVKEKVEKLEVVEIEGRICPRCERFINKYGRCVRMMCKCGYEFCWVCLKPLHYYYPCEIDPYFIFTHTRLVRVHHIRQKIDLSQYPPAERHKIENAKQKTTLFQHAFQQRLEARKPSSHHDQKALILKIVSAAQKDLHFKKEIIKTMEFQSSPEDEKTLTTLNIRPSVSHLIKSSQEIRGVLQHVSEFSYVLIQDTPHSVEKQRILRLANDLSGICSFFASILDLGDNQNPKTVFQRLVAIQEWAKRVLDALISATHRLRQQ